MGLTCTRCEGTGFLNAYQIDDSIANEDHETILAWLEEKELEFEGRCCSCHTGNPPCSYCTDYPADLQVCDCCGNSVDAWHGIPGEHYNVEDPEGPNGPYAYNGGLCECH